MASVSSSSPEIPVLAYHPHKVSGKFIICTEMEPFIPWRKCKNRRDGKMSMLFYV